LLRGRALLARDDTGLLQLGGFSQGLALFSGRSVSAEPLPFDDLRFPPNLRFAEYLRGYEDYAITTDRAAIASLAWRYPLIIDRGVAALFGILPASFLRQLDLRCSPPAPSTAAATATPPPAASSRCASS